MPPRTIRPPFDQFLATAEEVARQRPEVDLEIAREIFTEVAVMLDDGLALDGLDEHDTRAVVAGLCEALTSHDPAAAVQETSDRARRDPGDLHEPEVAAAAYLVAARVLRL